MKLGIMQGRLVPPEPGRFQSFPRRRWRDELSLAAAAGLDSIEWIFDAYGEDINPIVTDQAAAELTQLCQGNGIVVESLCADWFMDFPLIGQSYEVGHARWEKLQWLIERCDVLSIKRIVIPFVDASSIKRPDDIDVLVAGMRELTGQMERSDVELHLETDLGPEQFAALLSTLPQPWIAVNYDSGNSAALGYRPRDEFAAYGARVGSVHIKDRLLGAGTVPLGSGDTNFTELFQELSKFRYAGNFVLQVARGEEGQELAWTQTNVNTVRALLRKLST